MITGKPHLHMICFVPCRIPSIRISHLPFYGVCLIKCACDLMRFNLPVSVKSPLSRRVVEVIRLKPDTALIQRECVPEDTDSTVSRSEREFSRNDADRSDSIEDANKVNPYIV